MNQRVTVFGPACTGLNESDTLRIQSEDDVEVCETTGTLTVYGPREPHKRLDGVDVQRTTTYAWGRWNKFVVTDEIPAVQP